MACNDPIRNNRCTTRFPVLRWARTEGQFHHSHSTWRRVQSHFKYARKTIHKVSVKSTSGALHISINSSFSIPFNSPDRTVTTHFDETPLTSTYLIAFIVSDFEFVDNSPTSKIRHRVFANPKDYQEGRFAVDEGEKILNAIAGYLRVPFSLPKMDQFAIPDFNAGGDFTFRFDKASKWMQTFIFRWEKSFYFFIFVTIYMSFFISAMENWGLVTYREEYLLYNQSVHLPARKTNIVSIIAHEFGHQWFGNLVSPKWWTYIWLNEGFATLFDHIGTDLVRHFSKYSLIFPYSQLLYSMIA